MTGPEHYRKAERLLIEQEYETSADTLMAAQAHATLALAAAKALEVTATMPPHATQAAVDWREVLQPADAEAVPA